MNTVLFCSQPFSPAQVDADFAEEHRAAGAAGFATALFDHTQAAEQDVHKAVRKVPEGTGDVLYRGWMFTAALYESFYHALLARGARLVNDPASYRACHHLPESYPFLEGDTPRTTWLPVSGDVDMEAVMGQVAGLPAPELAGPFFTGLRGGMAGGGGGDLPARGARSRPRI